MRKYSKTSKVLVRFFSTPKLSLYNSKENSLLFFSLKHVFRLKHISIVSQLWIAILFTMNANYECKSFNSWTLFKWKSSAVAIEMVTWRRNGRLKWISFIQFSVNNSKTCALSLDVISIAGGKESGHPNNLIEAFHRRPLTLRSKCTDAKWSIKSERKKNQEFMEQSFT